MTKQGYIELTPNEVIFVYHELPKPDWDILMYSIRESGGEEEPEGKIRYERLVEEYEASKREVKIENASKPLYGYANIFVKDKNSSFPKTINVGNNRYCKAEIENNKALITKIL